MSNVNSLPILIVGNGPAGLIAALSLLRNGVPVRIIEKKAQFHIGQRGAGVQPRSLELYNLLGIPEIAAEGGELKPTCHHGPIGSQKVAEISMMVPRQENTPDKPFANGVLLGQHHAEEIFRSHIKKYGVSVELSTELVSLDQDADGVIAHVVRRDEDGNEVKETIRTPFLIGADGAKGITRKELGLTFSGESRRTHKALFGDIYIKGLDFNFWHRWGDAATRIINLRPTEYEDLWAVLLGGQVDYQPLLTDKEALTEFIHETTGRKDLIIGDVKELNEFSPNIRMVNKFSEGRAFVVGDAAHVHSPTGGQGMNSSVQDSFNLAWKLALVYKRLAPLSLLDTYNEERIPVIQEMLQHTSKLLNRALEHKASDHAGASHSPSEPSQTRSATSGGGNEAADPRRGGAGAGGAGRPRSLDQLGINYRWSSIVLDDRSPYSESKDSESSALSAYGMGAGDGKIRAGDRAPEAPGLVLLRKNAVNSDVGAQTSLFGLFSPTKHTVLFFVSSLDSDLKEIRDVVEVLATWPQDTLHLVLVLPKGTPTSIGASEPFHDLFQTSEKSVLKLTVVVDGEGHAQSAYGGVVEDGYPIFVVRPDGVVGGIVKGGEGVQKYTTGIFGGLN